MVSTVTTRPFRLLRSCTALSGTAASTVLGLAVLVACAESPRPPATLQVIPAPAVVELGPGSIHITDGIAIVARDAQAEPIAHYLADLLRETRGIRAEVSRQPVANSGIRLELTATQASSPQASSPEAYSLDAGDDGVSIRAADPRGLFYGAVTLWQLATSDGVETGPAEIPAVRIADTPRFAWRGLMLDSARHYQSPDFIKRLIDWMALHKLNVLHWHLTDDQGWRLEIRKFPELTRVGAWRVPAGAGRPPAYGGYYTQAQVRDIVAHAAARFVTIVPEIEMPGHAQAAIASYPRLGTGGSPPLVSPDWGVHDYLFNADESTFTFLEDVLSEVIELFPGEFVHVGGDEAVKNRWQASPRVQARIRELGLADEAALQGWFVARIARFLDGNGRRLIGWDEILDGGIPVRASVMSWRGTQGGIDAARAGHDVVMAPAPTLYLDYLQSSSAREPPGRPAVVTLEDVYEYEPVPAELSPAQAARILGAQLNAWTEHMRLPERIEHQAFPRVAAMAEVTWSPAAKRNWRAFQSRLGAQFARYRKLGIRYADTAFEPRFELARATDDAALRVSITQQSPYGTIRYTLDSDDPGPTSAAYEDPLDVSVGTQVNAAAFDGERRLGGPVALSADAQALQRRTDEQLAQCSGKLVLRLEDDAPPDGNRAVFNVDIIDPCWIWDDADLARGGSFRAAVGQLPFNFQIGKDADAIRRGDARTSAGELEVRAGDCRGEPIAVLPLAAAAASTGVSVVGPVPIAPQAGFSRLCLRFARPAIDPIWALQWAELGK
jgi:hexosaminidase